MEGVGSRRPVKVVIVDTEYVETDVRSFKSVVQRLTGKDSTAADEKKVRRRSREGRMAPADREKRIGLPPFGVGDVPVLMRDLSFKEFESLLNGMPWTD